MTMHQTLRLAALAGVVLAAAMTPTSAGAAPAALPGTMAGMPGVLSDVQAGRTGTHAPRLGLAGDEPRGRAANGSLDEPVAEPICHVTYQPTVFDSVIVAKVTIKNQSPAAINGWSLSFILPAAQRIIASSGSTYESPIDTIVARDVGTNAYVPSKESVLISFLIAHNGNLARPTAFSVNGHPCTTA